MEIADKFGNKLSLPDARLKHIKEKHPEMNILSIKTSLLDPDYIIASNIDEDIKIYHKKKGKYFIVAVVNTGKKLVITSFVSDKLKKGEIEWTKS